MELLHGLVWVNMGVVLIVERQFHSKDLSITLMLLDA